MEGNNELDQIIENDNVVNPYFINNQKVDLKNMPFIFRLRLNIEKMMDKETTILDLKTKVMAYWYNTTQNTKSMKKWSVMLDFELELKIYSFLDACL